MIALDDPGRIADTSANADEELEPASTRVAPLSIERYVANDFPLLVPGTTRRIWLDELIPELVAAGVLVKRGRAWFGRRAEIEAALLGRHAPTTRRRR